ncbi:MAG: FAA hydrolase family protein, partial [Vicinamibacterales bacterium]
MHSDRRTFLKSTAAGMVSATAATLASAAPLAAQAAASRVGPFTMPRNMTLLNMRTAAGPRLGVKLS